LHTPASSARTRRPLCTPCSLASHVHALPLFFTVKPFPLPPITLSRRATMISLTRLNGHPIVINSDLIKYIEASPDTMLTLIHGEKLVVLESCDDVVQRISQYRVRLLEERAACSEQKATRAD